MTIVSGTSSDRRNRILIFLGMCILFAGWFAIDGFVRYPAKNIKWAHQNLQGIESLPSPDAIQINPKALLTELQKIQTEQTIDEVKAVLGQPSFESDRDLCYIGPAAFGWFAVRDGRISEIKKVQMNSEPDENDIAWQKRVSYIMAALIVLTVIHLFRVLAAKVVLDDAGLRIAGRQIDWDAMQSMGFDELAAKGWVDLHYRAGNEQDSIRLDSYAIDRFEEIVTEICGKKGFNCPLKPLDNLPPQQTGSDD
jgi:hypothetical protein